MLPAAVLTAAIGIHVTALSLALQPRVGHDYAERYIALNRSCLHMPPPPVLAAIPAQLARDPVTGRCGSLLRAGWHPHEATGTWSSARRAVLELGIAPGLRTEDRSLTLRLMAPFGATVHPRVLRVLLDGAPVATERFTRDGATAIVIAGESLRPGATHRIELLLDRLYAPAELGLGDDRRRIGIAFLGLALE